MGILGLLLELLIQISGFAIVGGLVYFLTSALRLRYRSWTLTNARASALWAIAAVMVWCTAFVGLAGRLSPAEIASPSVREYDVAEVLTKLIVYAVFVAPSLLLMWLRKEPPASAGVSKQNLGGSLIVGSVLAAIIVLLTILGNGRSMGQVIGGLGIRNFWALFSYAIVGFGEEFAFRGYLQSRLVIWLGRWRGWVVSSVLMALAHVVSRVVFQGEPAIDAFFGSLSIIPVSLFLGYVMLRTENVVAPALAHMFADWILTLG